MYNHDNEYLHYQDDWYIIASKPGKYVFVYYRQAPAGPACHASGAARAPPVTLPQQQSGVDGAAPSALLAAPELGPQSEMASWHCRLAAADRRHAATCRRGQNDAWKGYGGAGGWWPAACPLPAATLGRARRSWQLRAQSPAGPARRSAAHTPGKSRQPARPAAGTGAFPASTAAQSSECRRSGAESHYSVREESLACQRIASALYHVRMC
jgi:hypothetical protein